MLFVKMHPVHLVRISNLILVLVLFPPDLLFMF